MDSIEQFGAEGLALAQVVALESVNPLPELQDLLSMPERTTRALAQSLTLSVSTPRVCGESTRLTVVHISKYFV